jgi:DNA-directed RNA polymerase specialized sigma24 family protein
MQARAKARLEGRVGGCPRLVVNRAKIMQLEEEGLSTREIAEEMDLSPASVHRILRSHRQSAKLELI